MQSHIDYIYVVFLQSDFLNVSKNCHIGCICVIFLQNEFSNESSNYMHMRFQTLAKWLVALKTSVYPFFAVSVGFYVRPQYSNVTKWHHAFWTDVHIFFIVCEHLTRHFAATWHGSGTNRMVFDWQVKLKGPISPLTDRYTLWLVCWTCDTWHSGSDITIHIPRTI